MTSQTETTKPTDTASTTEPTSTTEAPTTPATGYTRYEGGMKGEGVSRIQQRLYALGYYDQDITNYYGPFTRDAIKAFQKAIGVLPTGIADEDTQRALFADDAPVYSEENSIMNDDEYQMDEEEQTETGEETEEQTEEEPLVIADSEGIGSLSMTANPYSFTKNYGESGPLQTMGVFSYKAPSVMFYRDGESYSVSEEVMESLENCVFL